MSRARDFADLAGSSSNISTVAADSSTLDQVATSYGAGGITGKNLIINGAMQVAQRSTSETVGDSATYKTLDRWQIAINGTTAGRATMSRSSDAPNGFGHSMKFEVTTADTSIASTESFGVYQRIEGQNMQSLKKGTSDAQVATLSFYAKGTPNTYITEFRDANLRQVSATFDVTSSWQRFTIQVPADTTGTITSDNTSGFLVLFWLHAGTDFTSGTLNTSWAASVNANRMVGCDSLFSAVSNTLQITGIQLEVGEQATPFEHRSYGDELARCQRYYATSGIVLSSSTPSRYHNQINLPVTMRIQPTITAGGIDAGSGASIVPTWDTSNTPYSGRTFYQGTNHSTISNSRWNFDAEL